MAKKTAGPVIASTTATHIAAVKTSVAASATASAAVALAQSLHNATTQPGSLYAPQADTVASDATATRQAATNAVATSATAQADARALPAKILHVEQVNVQNGKSIVKSGLFYRVGRAVVITVFLLLALGGLILFSESGFASTLAVRWPLLATIIFKPLEKLGTLVGRVWGGFESLLIKAWKYIVVIAKWLWAKIAPPSPVS